MHGIILFLISLFAVSQESAEVHDFHLSKGSLKYKSEQKALQLTMHVYIDDFETALAERGIDSMYILTEKESEDAEKYIRLYIQETFRVKFDEKPVQMGFIGKELSDDMAGMWIYMEATEIEAPATAQIDYSVLMDSFDDQRNILSVQINDKADHLMFSDVDRRKNLSWKK